MYLTGIRVQMVIEKNCYVPCLKGPDWYLFGRGLQMCCTCILNIACSPPGWVFNHSVVVMQNILNPRAVPGAIQVEPLRGSLFVWHHQEKIWAGWKE